jgi:uncharacterized protein (TIGR02300 family)
VAKPEWGNKRMCQSCGTRYYDMRRETPSCPACGTVFVVKTTVRQRRPAVPVAKKPASPDIALDSEIQAPKANDDNKESAIEAIDDDDSEGPDSEAKDDSLIEDTSDLGEDDDDMSEVREHIDNEDMSDRGQ